MIKFSDWLEKKESEVKLEEAKNKYLGDEFESDATVLFNEYKNKLDTAEKIFKQLSKNLEKELSEINSYFVKFPPKSVKLLGAKLDLHSGFIDANIDFLIEFESQEGKISKDKIRYSLDKKKFI